MGLLANPWKMEVAGRWVAPSEEPAVLKPVALEPVALEPAVPEPVVPEPACPEWLSCVWPFQREVGITGIQVVPWVERSPEEACSKWRNLEGCGLEEVPRIQAYLLWRYLQWLLLWRRSLHTLESALQSGSTT